MRIVVTGGAGFLGSHLCDAIIGRGDTAVCVDNFATGRPDNVAHLIGLPEFTLLESDVSRATKIRPGVRGKPAWVSWLVKLSMKLRTAAGSRALEPPSVWATAARASPFRIFSSL